MTAPNKFYISLASDEGGKFFNVNKHTSEFTNKLNGSILLNGEYQVALTEIYIPPFSFANADTTKRVKRKTVFSHTKQTEAVLEIKLDGLDSKIYLDRNALGMLYTNTIEMSHLPTILFAHLQFDNLARDEGDASLSKRIGERLSSAFSNIDLNAEQVKRTIPENEEYFTLRVPTEVLCEHDSKLIISSYSTIIEPKKFNSLKDFINDFMVQLPKDSRNMTAILKALDKDPHFNKNLSLPGKSGLTTTYKQHFANWLHENRKSSQPQVNSSLSTPPAPPNLSQAADDSQAVDDPQLLSAAQPNENFCMLFVYSDIVAPHNYAAQNLHLLRVIPHCSNPLDGVHIRFETPEFFPVSVSVFESISIIVSNRGQSLNFYPTNKHPMYLQLCFQKL